MLFPPTFLLPSSDVEADASVIVGREEGGGGKGLSTIALFAHLIFSFSPPPLLSRHLLFFCIPDCFLSSPFSSLSVGGCLCTATTVDNFDTSLIPPPLFQERKWLLLKGRERGEKPPPTAWRSRRDLEQINVYSLKVGETCHHLVQIHNYGACF